MNIRQIFSFRAPTWQENVVGPLFLTTSVVLGFVVLAIAGNSVLQFAASLVMSFVSVIVGSQWALRSVHRYSEERAETIFKRLEALTTPQLVALRESPELSWMDQELVVEFLNTQRSGWSLSGT